LNQESKDRLEDVLGGQPGQLVVKLRQRVLSFVSTIMHFEASDRHANVTWLIGSAIATTRLLKLELSSSAEAATNSLLTRTVTLGIACMVEGAALKVGDRWDERVDRSDCLVILLDFRPMSLTTWNFLAPPEMDWSKCLRLPEGFLSPDSLDSLSFVEERENLTFPCPVYCTLGKRLYVASCVAEGKTPDSIQFQIGCEEITLSMLVAGKYGVTTIPGDEVIQASPEFPYKFFNFDGAQSARKPRTELAYLVKRLVIFLPNSVDFCRKIENLPVTCFHANRCREIRELLTSVSPSLSVSEPLLIDAVKALTSKHAMLGDLNYEKLEFLGDAVLQLILALTSSSFESFQDRKSNFFLHEQARPLLFPYLLDSTPTVHKPETLTVRGLFHPNAGKIFADAFEALVGAIFLHSSLETVFEATRNFQVSENDLAFALSGEISIAAFRLSRTLFVFKKPGIFSVGDLHAERERLIAGIRLRVFPDLEISSLAELDTNIRDNSD
jgi:hypothetical protein